MNGLSKPKRLLMLGYMLPSFLLFTFLVFVPVLFAIYYSQFDWSGSDTMTYVGFANFRNAMSDANFWLSFRNNIFLTVVCIIGQLGIAFLLACLLNAKNMRLKGFHRVASFFPYVLSAVVVGFIWRMMYDYNYGLINTVLRALGMEEQAKIWLSEAEGIMTVASIPLVWQYIGMYLIIMLAAMTSISAEVLEMAELDGANSFQRAIHITLPLIKSTFVISLMLCIAGNMKAFDHIYVLTRGGPGYSSTVMAMYAYGVSFRETKLGYGTALSILVLVISLVLVGGTRFMLSGGREKEGK